MREDAGEPQPEWVGRYEILRVLEAGPPVEVLLAHAHGPGGFWRPVVVKRYPRTADRDAQELSREATALALVSSPYVVQLHDFAIVVGQPLLVVEHVAGPSLADFAAALRAHGRHLADGAALYVGHAILSALAAAHHARSPDGDELAPIVHRDVNPRNVRLSWKGDVKLGGFAVSKRLRARDRTRPGILRGTYGYMAPEQALGEPPSVATDVYGAALVVYELLGRRRAFDVDRLPELELLKAMAYPRLPPLASLRPHLDPVISEAIDEALAPDPSARCVSARELAAILASAADLAAGRRACVAALAATRAEWMREATPKAPGVLVPAALPSEPDPTQTFRFDELPAHGWRRRPHADSIRASTSSIRAVRKPTVLHRAAAALGWIAAVALCALVAWQVLLLRQAMREASATVVDAPAPSRAAAHAPAPTPTPTRTPAPAPAPAPAPLPPTTGVLLTPRRAAGHRIYVDGRVVGEGKGAFEIRCGARRVQVGSAGHAHRVVVPCGGSVRVP